MKTPSPSTQSSKSSQIELVSVETKVNEEVGMGVEGEEFIGREESERNEEDGEEVGEERDIIRDNNGERVDEEGGSEERKEEGAAEEGEGELVVDEESDVKSMQRSPSSRRKPRTSRVWSSHSSSSSSKGKK